jgi:hypothetical protein
VKGFSEVYGTVVTLTRLCEYDPQGAGVGVPGGGDPADDAALRHAGA